MAPNGAKPLECAVFPRFIWQLRDAAPKQLQCGTQLIENLRYSKP